MPRRRLGVVLIVPSPLGDAVDGLRRAFSDPALHQVAPHITLVPPVNVGEQDLSAALAGLRAAAADARPLELSLGPVRVFPGDEHVAYLAVDGSPAAMKGLARLRSGVFRAPLARVVDHDFVPHVTVAQAATADRLAAITAAAIGWEAEPVLVDVVTLLEERHTPDGRRWVPIAEVALAAPRIVGRGGLEVELTPGRLVDPEAVLAVDPGGESDVAEPVPGGTEPLVVVARREGRVVGLVQGWTAGPASEVGTPWVHASARGHGIEDHLLAAFAAAAADRQG